MKLLLTAFVCLVVEISGDNDSGWSLKGNPLVAAHPCNGSTDIQVMYEPGTSPEEENKYDLWINKKFPKHTVINLKFDKDATVILSNKTFARINLDKSEDHAFRIRFFKSHEGIGFHVQGCTVGTVPYIQKVNINTKEYCQEPQMGFLDSYIEGYKYQAHSCTNEQTNDEYYNRKIQQQKISECGKRQTRVNALQANGESKRGDWPWHIAVFKRNEPHDPRYICGGTLISNHHVLTVAHCVYSRATGVILPENFIVALGKYELRREAEFGAQEREVEKITIHENFLIETLDNDIALLKLKMEVTFTEFIQPACLWYENVHKNLPSESIIGTIVGWGYDEDDKLPSKLNQLQISMISDKICIQNKPDFYSARLNGLKFCAGDLNVAVACNGDSGGGFHVFIPDKVGDNSTSGTWHVRGIISFAVPSDNNFVCSSDHYTVFTDVEKYTKWISSHM